MIEEEKVNRWKAFKRVRNNLDKLSEYGYTIESIYRITFSHPNFTFLHAIDNAGVKEITYQEAEYKIQIYGTLFKKHISNKSKFVGLLLDNKPDWIYSFYGLLMYGYIPVLLSTQNSIEQNKLILKEVKAHALITDKKGYSGLIVNPCALDLNAQIDNNKHWEDEIVFISSGTSGPNKIVSYTGKELCKQIFNGGEILKKNVILSSSYQHYLKHLVVLPFFHIFGFIAVFLWFSFFNVTFILPVNISPERIRQACIISEPTHIFAVPLFWDTIAHKINSVVKSLGIEKKFNRAIKISLFIQKILPKVGPKIARQIIFNKYLDDILGKSIRFCVTGGASISKSTLRIINGLGYPLVNGYGSTEIGISSFANPKCISGRLSPSIGAPFSIFQYELVSTKNGLNELHVRGPSTFAKALNGGKWVEHKDKLVRTYDAVEYHDNQYYLNGRLDEVFIGANGENIVLSQIESNLFLPNANDLALLYLKDTKEIIIILFYMSSVTKFQIAQDLKILNSNKIVVSNKITKIYITNQPFAKANGIKIKRHSLYESFVRYPKIFHLIKNDEYSSLLDEQVYEDFVLNKVINIFSQLYPNKSISKNVDFFSELGGDSLSYLHLIEIVEKEFNVKLVFDDKMICRTPIDFTKKIEEISRL